MNYQKNVKLSLTKNLDLYYFSLGNNKFFLNFTNKKKYKYFTFPLEISFKKQKNLFSFHSDEKIKSLLNSCVISFAFWLKNNNKNFKRKLLLKGLGFRCFLSEDKLKLNFKLGFSHIITLDIPAYINNVIVEKSHLTLESDDLSNLGNFCKKIKQLRVPDAYKGKGIFYKTDLITLKPVKKN